MVFTGSNSTSKTIGNIEKERGVEMRRDIGVDLHKNTFTVCYLSKEGRKLKSFKVSKKGIEAFK